MKNYRRIIAVLVFFVFLSATVYTQTTEFTYQGRLLNASAPATGNYDFELALFDAVSGGAQIGATLTRSSVAVANGDFSVKLDFGGAFPGANRFLEIRVRQSGGGAFTPLTPRQVVTSAPYSVKSLNTDQLGGVAASQYVTTTSGNSSYIQNTTSTQPASNFSISGNGTATGTLSGNIVNSATQYNIGGNRVLFAGFPQNVFVGLEAGRSTTGDSNSFVGFSAGYRNTTGYFNSFFGSWAGFSNTTGFHNSFFGTMTGQNTTGSYNAFFGTDSGANNNTASRNSFFGAESGITNTTGERNSFFGTDAGYSNLTGSGNSFFGIGAGSSNTIGSSNTLVGSSSNVSLNNLTNATAIGANAVVSQSNSLVLGNGVNVGIGTTGPAFKLEVVDSSNTGLRVQTNTSGGTVASFGANGDFYVDAPSYVGGRLTILENGNVGININNPVNKLDVAGIIAVWSLGSAGTAPLCQNASLQISFCSSSIRYKQSVSPFTQGLSLIKQLRPVSFNWRANNQADFGLVAEDVAAVEPLLTTTNDKGEIEGVKYDRVGVVLVNAVREQQAQIEAQARQIEQQRAEIEQLKRKATEIDELKAIICGQKPDAQLCRSRN